MQQCIKPGHGQSDSTVDSQQQKNQMLSIGEILKMAKEEFPLRLI